MALVVGVNALQALTGYWQLAPPLASLAAAQFDRHCVGFVLDLLSCSVELDPDAVGVGVAVISTISACGVPDAVGLLHKGLPAVPGHRSILRVGPAIGCIQRAQRRLVSRYLPSSGGRR